MSMVNATPSIKKGIMQHHQRDEGEREEAQIVMQTAGNEREDNVATNNGAEQDGDSIVIARPASAEF